MILYHGSYLPVEKPDVSFSRDNLDFGKGFYATSIYVQAKRWAERFKRMRGRGQSVVSVYELDEMCLDKNASILRFDTYSEEWLEYIVANRSGKDCATHDVIIGGVANDFVFDTVQLYLEGLTDKATALERLRYDKPNEQHCFRNQEIIDKCLKFLRSEVL